MENALRREEQETKALITDISHQLKTPVASLKMSYEIVDSTELSREEAREFQEKSGRMWTDLHVFWRRLPR